MKDQLRPALLSLLLLTLLTGVAYPLLVTVIAQTAFPWQAGGSLLLRSERTVGSALIGQSFESARYFWSRPSATVPAPYNAAASSGSNFGPLNPALHEAVVSRAAALRALDPTNDEPIPIDLVTASASGLDPDISPAAAEWQMARIARARSVSLDSVRSCLDSCRHGRQFGILGEPRVNVLCANLALDRLVLGTPR